MAHRGHQILVNEKDKLERTKVEQRVVVNSNRTFRQQRPPVDVDESLSSVKEAKLARRRQLDDRLNARNLRSWSLQAEVHVDEKVLRGTANGDLHGAHEVADEAAAENGVRVLVKVRRLCDAGDAVQQALVLGNLILEHANFKHALPNAAQNFLTGRLAVLLVVEGDRLARHSG